MAELCFTRVIT